MPQIITTFYPTVTADTSNVKEDGKEYPPQKQQRTKNPHDKYFKATLGDVNNAKDFLYHYLPDQLLHVTNLDTLEPQKDSFINQNLEESYSDLLFKTSIQGQPGYFYFLFEHKSYVSKDIALQLLKYMTEIWQAKANKERDWELPIIIPLVIYHGQRNWNPPQSLGKMIVGYELLPKNLRNYVPDFEYIIYDLARYSDEEIKGSAQLKAYLTICRDILTDDGEQFLNSLFKAVDYLLEIDDKETRLVYFQLLMHYIFQAGKNLTEQDTKRIVKKIPEGREVVMTLAEQYRNEGEKIGLEKGVHKGIIEVAKNLILKEFKTEDIIEVTGLTKQEVEHLQKELGK